MFDVGNGEGREERERERECGWERRREGGEGVCERERERLCCARRVTEDLDGGRCLVGLCRVWGFCFTSAKLLLWRGFHDITYVYGLTMQLRIRVRIYPTEPRTTVIARHGPNQEPHGPERHRSSSLLLHKHVRYSATANGDGS